MTMMWSAPQLHIPNAPHRSDPLFIAGTGKALSALVRPTYQCQPTLGNRGSMSTVRRQSPEEVKAMSAINLSLVTTSIRTKSKMSAGVKALIDREAEFRTMTRKSGSDLLLTGLCLIPESREALDTALSDAWGRDPFNLRSGRTYDEVIIGSGPHAAIYASVRTALGFPKPLVIDQSYRPGGTFAITRNPSWYLNSANRPGLVGVPGQGQALNYFPGFPVQPADITSAEYPPNSDIGICTRLALAKSADVIAGRKVTESYLYGSVPYVEFANGVRINARRIIDATGLGEPRDASKANGTTIQTFPQFLARFDEPWPLRDLQRVAVIGDGDSARCAVEALLGIGPSNMMSLASLDYVSEVTWYGRSVPTTCETFRQTQRTRYSRLAKYIGTPRLRVRNDQSKVYPVPAMNSAVVGSQSYDLVIMCTGYAGTTLYSDYDWTNYRDANAGIRSDPIATKVSGYEVYRVGPAAQLGFTDDEYALRIPERDENRVALFRYANKTAALATTLPAPNRLF